jgi:putative ABC transport system substrate-binding protein
MTDLRRREFITLIGGAAVSWPLAARAQPARKVWRIGFLSGRERPVSIESTALGGFPQGMRELGYVEGKDFTIEWRFSESRYELIPQIAAELVRMNPNVIVLATPAAVRPLRELTTTIPIVMGYSTDPVGNGFVATLARPGGNITGLASSADDASPKHLDLLAAIVPNLSRVGLLINPGNPNSSPVLKSIQASAQKANLTVMPLEAQKRQEISTAFVTLANERVGAVILVGDALFNSHLREIAELAISHRLPSIYTQREYAEAGGLMSYGDSLKEFYRRAASFVDKIFKGAKPADLPIEQPTRFNLVINRKTAEALGITIPSHLFIFADEVIE